MQGNFIALLECKIGEQALEIKKKDKEFSDALKRWDEWTSKDHYQKNKLWSKMGMLEEAMANAKDDMETAQKNIGHLMMKKKTSTTSGTSCFSCFNRLFR